MSVRASLWGLLLLCALVPTACGGGGGHGASQVPDASSDGGKPVEGGAGDAGSDAEGGSAQNACVLPGHSELGTVTSTSDGVFWMAVNGGGLVTLKYALPGYLPLQRHLPTRWNQYEYLPAVTLTPAAAPVAVNLGSAATASGTTATDGLGARTPFVFFPAGTSAALVMRDGSSSPLSSLHLRMAEYTVGDTGPSAMPADLPPTTDYTFCASYGVDEADAQGASRVAFSAPVPTYVALKSSRLDTEIYGDRE